MSCKLNPVCAWGVVFLIKPSRIPPPPPWDRAGSSSPHSSATSCPTAGKALPGQIVQAQSSVFSACHGLDARISRTMYRKRVCWVGLDRSYTAREGKTLAWRGRDNEIVSSGFEKAVSRQRWCHNKPDQGRHIQLLTNTLLYYARLIIASTYRPV